MAHEHPRCVWSCWDPLKFDMDLGSGTQGHAFSHTCLQCLNACEYVSLTCCYGANLTWDMFGSMWNIGPNGWAPHMPWISIGHSLMILRSLCFEGRPPFGSHQFQLDQSRSLCDHAILQKSMCFSGKQTISVHFKPSNYCHWFPHLLKHHLHNSPGTRANHEWSGHDEETSLCPFWEIRDLPPFKCCAGRAETWNTMRYLGHLGLSIQTLDLKKTRGIWAKVVCWR